MKAPYNSSGEQYVEQYVKQGYHNSSELVPKMISAQGLYMRG